MTRFSWLLLLLAAAAMPLAAADVTGKWNFSVDLDIGSGNPTFTFQQNGERLTGTYSGAAGTADIKGTVKGDRIEFEFSVLFNGQTFKVRYSGTIESETQMKGTANYGDQARGTWAATKAE